jgi:hypothetical protein
MPLRLEDNETLMIDYIDDRLKIRGVNLDELIPESLRRAFEAKL